MSDALSKSKELNACIIAARNPEELEQVVKDFYADNVEQCEAGQPIKKGLQAVLEAERGFFQYLANGRIEGLEVLRYHVCGDTVFQDQIVKFTLKNNPNQIVAHQLAEQEWKNGKLVREVFWHEKH